MRGKRKAIPVVVDRAPQSERLLALYGERRGLAAQMTAAANRGELREVECCETMLLAVAARIRDTENELWPGVV
jgi:hypothetical protein